MKLLRRCQWKRRRLGILLTCGKCLRRRRSKRRLVCEAELESHHCVGVSVFHRVFPRLVSFHHGRSGFLDRTVESFDIWTFLALTGVNRDTLCRPSWFDVGRDTPNVFRKASYVVFPEECSSTVSENVAGQRRRLPSVFPCHEGFLSFTATREKRRWTLMRSQAVQIPGTEYCP